MAFSAVRTIGPGGTANQSGQRLRTRRRRQEARRRKTRPSRRSRHNDGGGSRPTSLAIAVRNRRIEIQGVAFLEFGDLAVNVHCQAALKHIDEFGTVMAVWH